MGHVVIDYQQSFDPQAKGGDGLLEMVGEQRKGLYVECPPHMCRSGARCC